MRNPFLFAALLLASASTGCLYADVRTPLAYRSPTPADVGGQLGKEAKGEACSHAVLWLVAWGDGGYDAAVREAKAASGASLLADVKADTTYFNVVLGIYQRRCTAVTGKIAEPAPQKPLAAPPLPPPPPPGALPPPPPPGPPPGAPPPPPPPGSPPAVPAGAKP